MRSSRTTICPCTTSTRSLTTLRSTWTDRSHTNGCENFWSLLKRSIKGTYVSVEPFHLFRYLDEQAFRFNERAISDGTRIRADALTRYRPTRDVSGAHRRL